MWPFKKIKTLSDCVSGVLTCDGKNHIWSAWKDEILTGVAWKSGMSEPLHYRKNIQERTCVVCNYRERRELD